MEGGILKFTVGEKFPDWFNMEVSKGRAKINQDEQGNLVNVTLFTVSKQITAMPGDVVVKASSGLTLIPQKKAVKYNVIPDRTKKSKRGGNKNG